MLLCYVNFVLNEWDKQQTTHVWHRTLGRAEPGLAGQWRQSSRKRSWTMSAATFCGKSGNVRMNATIRIELRSEVKWATSKSVRHYYYYTGGSLHSSPCLHPFQLHFVGWCQMLKRRCRELEVEVESSMNRSGWRRTQYPGVYLKSLLFYLLLLALEQRRRKIEGRAL